MGHHHPDHDHVRLQGGWLMLLLAPANLLVEDMATKILEKYDKALSDELEAGLDWYWAASGLAEGFAERHNRTHAQASGIIAALSPRERWERNLVYADEFMGGGFPPTLTRSVGWAMDIDDGKDPRQVLRGPKTRAFFENILNPEFPFVTVDGWAAGIAAGQRLNQKQRSQMLNRKGGYERVASAYRIAAAMRRVLPCQMQAVTWVVERGSAT